MSPFLRGIVNDFLRTCELSSVYPPFMNPFPLTVVFDNILENLEVLRFKAGAFHGLDIITFYWWAYSSANNIP
ncbi:MAG: hypothetical protein ACW97O_06580, partial [Candidatus Thorarchaeota archaeon]